MLLMTVPYKVMWIKRKDHVNEKWQYNALNERWKYIKHDEILTW